MEISKKFNFRLTDAAIYQAVKWTKWFQLDRVRRLRKPFALVFILCALSFLILPSVYPINEALVVLGFGLANLFLVLYLIIVVAESFFNTKLKQPKLKTSLSEVIDFPHQFNLAEFLGFEAARAVNDSLKHAKSKKFDLVNSDLLFYYLIKDNPDFNFVFLRVKLSINEVKKLLEQQIGAFGDKELEERFSPDFQTVILESFSIASQKRHRRIEAGDVLTALSRHNHLFRKLLIEVDLQSADIENLVWWLESSKKRVTANRKWWSYENLIRKGTLAKGWTAGYTLTLDRYSIDWTEIIRKRGFEEIVGRKKEIEAIERILDRQNINNILLIGKPGCGRKSIIHALALKSFFGRSLPTINHKRVVELDLVSLLAQLEDPEEVESTLNTIFQEVASAGNVILVIDEIHNYIEGVNRPGVVDITGILTPFLRLPQFQIIAITNFIGLHKYIELNSSVLSLFEKVEVGELSPQETIMILEGLTPVWERKYKRFLTYPALKEAVSYSVRYIPEIPLPKKALDLLDEVMIYVSRYTKSKIVLPKHVAKIISEKTQIPVGEVELKEKEVLLNLEKLIHKRIVNQNEAVGEVASALRRARSQVTANKGPMGTFLFLGPTGVGKTETAKALAEIYFGSEDKMIRLDMSEFQNVNDIPRLLGAPHQEGLLTTQVRENPFSLVLLDELEKAHPNILNLFLQVLDEGHLTDGVGRKVSFINTIIIATSNAGCKIVLEAIQENIDFSGIKQRLLDHLFAQDVFRPEFINRFDDVAIFQPLSKENLMDITQLMLEKVRKNLQDKNIDFNITELLKEKIVRWGASPIFGARDIKRVIQNKVENALAEALLSGTLRRGQQVWLEQEGDELKPVIKQNLQ